MSSYEVLWDLSVWVFGFWGSLFIHLFVCLFVFWGARDRIQGSVTGIKIFYHWDNNISQPQVSLLKFTFIFIHVSLCRPQHSPEEGVRPVKWSWQFLWGTWSGCWEEFKPPARASLELLILFFDVLRQELKSVTSSCCSLLGLGWQAGTTTLQLDLYFQR